MFKRALGASSIAPSIFLPAMSRSSSAVGLARLGGVGLVGGVGREDVLHEEPCTAAEVFASSRAIRACSTAWRYCHVATPSPPDSASTTAVPLPTTGLLRSTYLRAR